MCQETRRWSASTSQPLEQSTSLHSDIAVLAFQLWQDRGAPEGSPEKDWYEAERQLTGQPDRLPTSPK